MERLRVRWQHKSCLTVQAFDRSKGLTLLWHSNIEVEIQSYSAFHIDANVLDLQLNVWWRFTGFYGHYVASRKVQSWDFLRVLSARSSLPWIVAGDFNEILRGEEKSGGRPRPMYSMNNFKTVVSD
ncbi:hypothetical protein PTKIN_Ptkin17bG0091500 [Pterospermum kingtungense]